MRVILIGLAAALLDSGLAWLAIGAINRGLAPYVLIGPAPTMHPSAAIGHGLAAGLLWATLAYHWFYRRWAFPWPWFLAAAAYYLVLVSGLVILEVQHASLD